MQAVALITRLHEHRAWTNRQLIETARRLTEEQLRKPFAIGHGSVWKSLLHLYAAEFVWLEALLGNERPLLPGDAPGKLPGNQEQEQVIRSVDQLDAHWQTLERRWADYLAALTEEQLDELVYKASTSSGADRRHATRRADVLLHVCTHAQYTTAQIVNMLRQLDVRPLPDVMLITLARSSAAHGGRTDR